MRNNDSDSMINIIVKTFDRKIDLMISTSMTIHELKQLICMNNGIPVELQCLMYLGRKMTDNGTLDDNFVKDNSTIDLIYTNSYAYDNLSTESVGSSERPLGGPSAPPLMSYPPPPEYSQPSPPYPQRSPPYPQQSSTLVTEISSTILPKSVPPNQSIQLVKLHLMTEFDRLGAVTYNHFNKLYEDLITNTNGKSSVMNISVGWEVLPIKIIRQENGTYGLQVDKYPDTVTYFEHDFNIGFLLGHQFIQRIMNSTLVNEFKEKLECSRLRVGELIAEGLLNLFLKYM